MPCFGSKRAEIIPSTTQDGVGRFNDGKGGKASARDGLHSAPTSQDTTNDPKRRLHSAPNKANDAKNAAGCPEPIGDFIIEAAGGDPPTAEAVDAYLDSIIGTKIVKDLRNAEWASRVAGLEALQQLIKRRAAEDAEEEVATGSETPKQGEGERAALFRACVTVMTRALQDKVVPVYLPALALLSEAYSPAFLEPIASGKLPRAAIGCFAHQLAFRAGSSNVRAKEESSAALLALARNEAVGCQAIGPVALRPLSNSKSAHAAVGRLELLRTLIGEFGLGDLSGMHLAEVLHFVLPLCECASEKSRDLAFGIVLDVRAINTSKTERLIEEIRPSVLTSLRARLAPPGKAEAGAAGLSVSGKRLPPLAPIGPGGMPGAMPEDEILAVAGTPPEAAGRARARASAMELGARNAAAPAKKKSGKRVDGSPRRATDPDDPDGLLAEATSMLDEPRPIRLAAGNAGVSPSKHGGGTGRARPDMSAAVEVGDADEVTRFMSEEQLMESILEQTR